MITICLAIVFLSLLILHVTMQRNKDRRLINKIPGPTAIPLLGNSLMFNVSSEQLWNMIIRIQDEFYPIVRMFLGMMNVVFLRHPDDMKILLSCKKNIDKGNLVYGTIKSIDNDGLIMSTGEKWRQRRKMLNLAFNPNLLKVYIEITNEHAKQLIRSVTNQNKEIHVVPDTINMFSKLSLAIVCEATMGADLNKFGTEIEEEFRHSIDEISQIVFYRASRPYIKDWMLKFLNVGRRQECALKRARSFINKIIQNRRAYHEKVGYRDFQHIVDDVEEETFTNQRKILSVLDLLLAAEKKGLIDEKGVQEEVEIFIIAGYETSGVAMSFALMLLAENKAIQELARDEVTQLFEETEGALTIEAINKLDYLDRCIKETLRLYPSAPLIGRCIAETIKLSNYEIPPNTDAVIQFFSLHRDPNFWPDPEKFDPDRFLPENTQERHPFAYLPFSAGPRACIGSKLGSLEVKATVARILYHFYLEPVDLTANARMQVHTTIHPTDPLRIKLIKINRDS